MFCYRFNDAPKYFFSKKNLPYLTWLSVSHDDYSWNSPYQSHDDCLEIAYIEKGIAYYNVDLQSFIAREGEAVIINPAIIHAVDSSKDSPTTIWVMHIKNFKIGNLEENHLLIDKPFTLLDLKDNNDFIKSFLYELHFLYENNHTSADYVSSFGISALLALFYDMQDDKELDILNTPSTFEKKIIFYLNDHYKEQIKLEDIANVFNISPSHLSHEFSKFFGISPINYIINKRICEAKWQLCASTAPLEEIAFSLGFNNINHFKKIFEKRVGCQPSLYRSKYKDKQLQ